MVYLSQFLLCSNILNNVLRWIDHPLVCSSIFAEIVIWFVEDIKITNITFWQVDLASYPAQCVTHEKKHLWRTQQIKQFRFRLETVINTTSFDGAFFPHTDWIFELLFLVRHTKFIDLDFNCVLNYISPHICFSVLTDPMYSIYGYTKAKRK